MAEVETTTIRVRRSTQRRLAQEAKEAGMSVIEMVDAAADLWEEQRLLDSMDESYEKYGDEIREEMKDWIGLPDGSPDAG
jgi:TRAP-type C4-dicarboxylate transport system substrate-binding protein